MAVVVVKKTVLLLLAKMLINHPIFKKTKVMTEVKGQKVGSSISKSMKIKKRDPKLKSILTTSKINHIWSSV